MKNFFAVFSIIISLSGLSQTGTFPQNWIGNWKGELKWFKTGVKEQGATVELSIEDPNLGHGALVLNPAKAKRLLDLFLAGKK